jgi:nitrilase
VMSWPNHFPTISDPMRSRVMIDSQAFAQMTKAYVVSACGTVDEGTIAKLELSPEEEEFIRNPDLCGGSVIVAPDSRVIAGPLGADEGILYAELDLEAGIKMKLRHDFAGHYNRPDIFQLRINTRAPQIYAEVGPEQPPALESDDRSRYSLPAEDAVLQDAARELPAQAPQLGQGELRRE